MSAFYNEFDPGAAAWLRELIAAGLIAPGVVDERSVAEVLPSDLEGFSQVHLFAGVGGWPLALRLAGWPADQPVWTGSCPCQPFSSAGAGAGTDDERHLWPEFLRLIRERRPPVCFGEQVASNLGRDWLAGVRADLEAVAYAVGAVDLGAASVGAPHRRQRLWWVADAGSWGQEGADDSDHDGVCRAKAAPRQAGVIGASGDDPRRLADPVRDGPQSGTGPQSESGSAGAPQGEVEERQRRGPDDGRSGATCDGRLGIPRSGERGRGLHEGPGETRRTEGEDSEGPRGEYAGEASGARFWDSFDLVPCSDGKARRIEPGTFPLVAGLPRGVGCLCAQGVPLDPRATAEGRVLRLKGYGNSIVPEVGAAFVRAYMEIR